MRDCTISEARGREAKHVTSNASGDDVGKYSFLSCGVMSSL